MPTVFDSFKPRLSHQLTSMQSARDKITLDLKDAARFTFDHGSKASKKIFASIPTQILRQKLDDRTTQHLEQHGDVHNRGAAGTGLQQYSTRGQHGQHEQQGPQGQQGKETGSLNKQNDWRTSNPIPGMGEFRRRQDTDQTNAYDLDMLETQMKRVGRRVNFMSFAPELMPQRPKRNKKTSYNFTSRNQKTEQLAANRRKKKGKRRRTQRERNNSIRSATSTTSTTSSTSATSTTSAILAKVQRMQDKKKNIRKRKEVKKHQEKMERINASKKIQAIHRGKKERKKVELLKESRTSATRKIQSMHRGKQARKKVEVLKQSKKEESATRKIQSMHRGKQARHRVKEIKASRKIQAIHRGKKGRSRVQSMRKIKRDAARLLEEKNEEEEEDYDPDALFAEFASSSEEDGFSDNESEEDEFSDND
jgi:hypothetical protein